jgi:hypothetical protein
MIRTDLGIARQLDGNIAQEGVAVTRRDRSRFPISRWRSFGKR